MTAPLDAIRLAYRHGVILEAHGDRLRWSSREEPPVDVLEVLRQQKAAILDTLAQDQDRRDGFEERAAIAEYGGGLTRSEAEALAAAELGCIPVDEQGIACGPCPSCGARELWRYPHFHAFHDGRWRCYVCDPIPRGAGPCDAVALPGT